MARPINAPVIHLECSLSLGCRQGGDCDGQLARRGAEDEGAGHTARHHATLHLGPLIAPSSARTRRQQHQGDGGGGGGGGAGELRYAGSGGGCNLRRPSGALHIVDCSAEHQGLFVNNR
eukprot:COSAG01_NODE_258_length_20077_cov_124.162429_34_plen_119_part_00